MRYVRQFFRFLYDFLVGDAWELFVGPIVALVLAWLLFQAGVDPTVVGGVLFLSVLVIVVAHIAIALRSSTS
jgi:hypothetical protein